MGICQPGNYSAMGRQHVTHMIRIYGGEGGAQGTQIVMKGKTTEEYANDVERCRHVDVNDIGEPHATHERLTMKLI